LVLSLTGWFTDSRSAILGAALGYLILWGFFHLFRLLISKGGWDSALSSCSLRSGLGWVGNTCPWFLLLSACAGALVGTVLVLVRQRDHRLPIPFGPYLAAAGWVGCLLWGERPSIEPISNGQGWRNRDRTGSLKNRIPAIGSPIEPGAELSLYFDFATGKDPRIKVFPAPEKESANST